MNKNRELTLKQKRFCEEYLLSGNATAAYRIAYGAEGYSYAALRVQAHRQMKRPNISLTVEWMVLERAQKNEVSQASLTAEFEKTYQAALEQGKIGAALAALRGKAKLHGYNI